VHEYIDARKAAKSPLPFHKLSPLLPLVICTSKVLELLCKPDSELAVHIIWRHAKIITPFMDTVARIPTGSWFGSGNMKEVQSR
jgi:hypothetical protein